VSDTVYVPGYYSQNDTGATWSSVPNYPNLSGETSYGYNAGTSMATPMVSGIAALILSVNSSLTPSQVRDIVVQTADDKGPAGFDTVYGWGRVNAFRAVSKANGTPAAPTNLQMGTKKINPTTYCPKLTWTANSESDLMVYRIYRRFSSDPPTFSKIDSVSYQTTTYVDYSVQTGTLDYAYYKITAVDAAPLESGFSNEVNIQTNQTSKPIAIGDDKESNSVPHEFRVEHNYPNPFNPTTQIRYGLPEQSRITLTIFNELGQEVRRLVDGSQAPGYPTAIWNGTNSAGEKVASGVYLYKLEAVGSNGATFVQTKKLLLLK
jgi:hypothetical protein